MSEEFKVPPELIDKMPLCDRQVIALAPIFFYAKYKRETIRAQGFGHIVPDIDLNAGIELPQLENMGAGEDIVGVFADAVTKHPLGAALFPDLNDRKIRDICYTLDEIFENQEDCAGCEGWSYYERGPEEFAMSAAEMTLWLRGGEIGLSWFSRISGWKKRKSIIEAVLKDRLAVKISGELQSGRT